MEIENALKPLQLPNAKEPSPLKQAQQTKKESVQLTPEIHAKDLFDLDLDIKEGSFPVRGRTSFGCVSGGCNVSSDCTGSCGCSQSCNSCATCGNSCPGC